VRWRTTANPYVVCIRSPTTTELIAFYEEAQLLKDAPSQATRWLREEAGDCASPKNSKSVETSLQFVESLLNSTRYVLYEEISQDLNVLESIAQRAL